MREETTVITAARVEAICVSLRAAGDRWPAVARALPEFAALSRGKPPGRATHRPWVLLNGEHESYEAPLRLSLHETGVWYQPGTYLTEIEKEAHRGQAWISAADAAP